MLRVHVIHEHSSDLQPYGCSYIRLLLPLRHPSNAPALQVTFGPTLADRADVVIVERMWKPLEVTTQAARQLVQAIRRMGAAFLYTLDDNLLDLRPRNLTHQGFTEEQRMVVRYFAREADGLIVSTSELARRLAPLNSNIQVVKNALDERFVPQPFGVNRQKHKRKIIGYMGTRTHDADFIIVMQALRAMLQRHPEQYEIQVVGGLADTSILRAFAGLPLRVLKIGDSVDYPKFMRWMAQHVHWDLAIAPLEDTPFTRCKSDIKFLDYSAFGIAGIYSRVLPYEHTVEHLETGYLAENTPQAWQAALKQLLNDDALRDMLARKAHATVWGNRMLAQCAPQWVTALQTCLAAA